MTLFPDAARLLLTVAILVSPAHAQAVGDMPLAPAACQLDGWANAVGEGPVTLRATPAPEGASLGELPLFDGDKSSANGDVLYPAELTVTGYENQYLLVTHLTDQENAEAARPLPAIPGWIPADAIRFTIQSGQGHQAPDAGSPVLIDLHDDWAGELGEIETVHACQADWVLVSYRQTLQRNQAGGLDPVPQAEQRAQRMWFRNICGNMFTTCDQGGALAR